MTALSPRLVSLLGLLALLPVAAYVLDAGTAFVALTAVNVLLVVGSLWTMFTPVAGDHGPAHA
jgi:sugar (pentulose or hexulose) kinase